MNVCIVAYVHPWSYQNGQPEFNCNQTQKPTFCESGEICNSRLIMWTFVPLFLYFIHEIGQSMLHVKYCKHDLKLDSVSSNSDLHRLDISVWYILKNRPAGSVKYIYFLIFRLSMERKQVWTCKNCYIRRQSK